MDKKVVGMIAGAGGAIGLMAYFMFKPRLSDEEQMAKNLANSQWLQEAYDYLYAKGAYTKADALLLAANDPLVKASLEEGKYDQAGNQALRILEIHVADVPVGERPQYIQDIRTAVERTIAKVTQYKALSADLESRYGVQTTFGKDMNTAAFADDYAHKVAMVSGEENVLAVHTEVMAYLGYKRESVAEQAERIGRTGTFYYDEAGNFLHKGIPEEAAEIERLYPDGVGYGTRPTWIGYTAETMQKAMVEGYGWEPLLRAPTIIPTYRTGGYTVVEETRSPTRSSEPTIVRVVYGGTTTRTYTAKTYSAPAPAPTPYVPRSSRFNY